jgi:hypothetical protein
MTAMGHVEKIPQVQRGNIPCPLFPPFVKRWYWQSFWSSSLIREKWSRVALQVVLLRQDARRQSQDSAILRIRKAERAREVNQKIAMLPAAAGNFVEDGKDLIVAEFGHISSDS